MISLQMQSRFRNGKWYDLSNRTKKLIFESIFCSSCRIDISLWSKFSNRHFAQERNVDSKICSRRVYLTFNQRNVTLFHYQDLIPFPKAKCRIENSLLSEMSNRKSLSEISNRNFARERIFESIFRIIFRNVSYWANCRIDKLFHFSIRNPFYFWNLNKKDNSSGDGIFWSVVCCIKWEWDNGQQIGPIT